MHRLSKRPPGETWQDEVTMSSPLLLAATELAVAPFLLRRLLPCARLAPEPPEAMGIVI